MKKALSGRYSFAWSACAAALIALLPASFSQAATTGWLSPGNGNGFYTQWNTTPPDSSVDEGSQVNDGIGCAAGTATWWVSSAINQRSTGIITVPGSVPDGSTIDSVDVRVCQSRSSAGVDGSTFQTFVRVNSTNIDSGTNITAATPYTSPAANTQNITVGVIKSGTTTLQAGVLKTNEAPAPATLTQRIYTLAARINYTLPTTTTTLACASPIYVGNGSLCTATVTPSAGGNTPSSGVNWFSSDAGSFSGISCTPGAGTLTCSATYTPNGVGAPEVLAAYSGDTNMTGSLSNIVSVQVDPYDTTTSVSCTSPIYVDGVSVCTATVVPTVGSSTPPGAVTWSTTDAGSFSGESCTPGAGVLTCSANYTPSGVGTPVVSATYAGDVNFNGSNGSGNVQVDPYDSATTVNCASPINVGDVSVCTATVAPTAGSLTPTGAVTWSATDGGSFSGQSCTPGAGTLSCTATFTPTAVGLPMVTATYAGDANTNSSNGSDDVQVSAHNTTTTVSCASPINDDGTSACTATVLPVTGSSTPTGAVTWSTTDGGSFSGQSCTPGAGTLSCVATFTPEGVGAPTVTATYAGDANTNGSNGSDEVQVNAAPAPTQIPVFGPFGLLLSIVGLGLIGGWQSRRRV